MCVCVCEREREREGMVGWGEFCMKSMAETRLGKNLGEEMRAH